MASLAFVRPSLKKSGLPSGARIFPDTATALDAGLPDIAVVAAPADVRAEVIEPLLGAGVPLYVEKPIAIIDEECKAIAVALGRNPNVPTLCGCNLRFLPSLQTLKRWLDDSTSGAIRASLQAGQWLPDWRPGRDYRAGYSGDPQKGGGVIFDLVHELDVALWLFGEVREVQAMAARTGPLELRAEQAAVTSLRAASGTLVSLGLDYIARPPARRYEIVTAEGRAVWDLGARELSVSGQDGKWRVLARGAAPFDVNGTYLRAWRHFLEAISRGEATAQPLATGLAAAALAIRVRTAAGL